MKPCWLRGLFGGGLLLVCATDLGAACDDVLAGYPSATITNGIVTVRLMLPHPTQGFYRGCRFDGSGLIARVTYRGHTFFAPWKTPHDPTNSESAIGPCEEFGMGVFGMPTPLGYDEAKVGEPFVKIGVGWLEKIEETHYRFGYAYRITKPGTWQTEAAPDRVTFAQTMDGPRGWAYHYTKRVVVPEGTPGFRIEHVLKNTGSRPIHTTVYNHHFTMIDDQPIGPAYVVRFGFDVTAKRSLKDIARVQGREIVFRRTLKPREAVFSDLSGFGRQPTHNDITIENRQSGAGIRIKGSRPVVQVHFFAARTAVCPEPFVELPIAPGQQARWHSDYRLFTVSVPPAADR